MWHKMFGIVWGIILVLGLAASVLIVLDKYEYDADVNQEEGLT